MSERLTDTQRKLLEIALKNGGACPGPHWASSAASLERRNLLYRDNRAVYRITEAGRAALREQKDESHG